MNSVFLDGIGVLGPGLTNWQTAKPLLQSKKIFTAVDIAINTTDLLPMRERRRVGQTTLLALHVAKEACDNAFIKPKDVPAVFVASAGDLENLDYLCKTLANDNEDERRLSPTKFHNSVHNAAAGYWAIATGCQKMMNCLSGGDYSVANGFIEAMTQVVVEQSPILLVIYDIPTPPPLNGAYPVQTHFASAWVLQPQKSAHSFAKIDFQLTEKSSIKSTEFPDLAAISLNNPSAQVLPLLQAIATKSTNVAFALNSHQKLQLDINHLS